MVIGESIRQITFVSGVLAGFAFTIVAQLILLKDEKRITPWVIGAFLISSSLLLVTTFVGSILLIRVANAEARESMGVPPPLIHDLLARTEYAQILMLTPFSFGLAAFVFGISLIGWMHSKRLGLLSVAAAVASVILASIILGSLLRPG
jgi:hypothetical protein